MSADLSIDYTDGREDIWIPVGPQSWLTNHWKPIAEDRDWKWIGLICSNVCQVFSQQDALALLTQLIGLRGAITRETTIDEELTVEMLERLDQMIPAIENASTNWDGVKYISIG